MTCPQCNGTSAGDTLVSCSLCNSTGYLVCGNPQRSDGPPKPTKPSAGALRATRAIGKTCKGVGITHLSHEWMAEVIDRETGMAELLGATGLVVKEFLELSDGIEDTPLSVQQLQQAIAKCERKE